MKNWIFDLDGTLVDSYPSFRTAVVEGFAGFDVKLGQEDLDLLRHLILPKLVEKFLDPKLHQLANQKIHDLIVEHQKEVQLFEGIQEIIQFLHSKEVHLSVFTARDLTSAQQVLKTTGLDRYFHRCISRNCVPNSKPAPDGIHAILSATGAEAQQTIMIGDHPMDLKSARSAGVKAVGVLWNHPDPELEALADHHFSAVMPFKAWVQAQFDFH